MKNIPSYEGLYLITPDGKVFSEKTKKFLSQRKHNKGYLKVQLFKNKKCKHYFVHRLVMLTFVGKSKNQVNHIDGDKKNNHISNLEYVTPKQNMKHCFEKGIHTGVGESHVHSKLKKEEVLSIREDFKKGISQSKIAKKYSISQPSVNDILKGRTWKHLT